MVLSHLQISLHGKAGFDDSMKHFSRLLIHRCSCIAGKPGLKGKLHLKTLFIVIVLSFMGTGCAQLYHGFQAQSVQSCYSLPYSEQQECLEGVRSTYEAYEMERKKED